MSAEAWTRHLRDSMVQGFFAGGTTYPLSPHNLIATRDPLVTDDITQGYYPGSEWVNITTGQTSAWLCVGNSTGAAVWIYNGAKVGDPEPSGIKTAAGGASRGAVLGSFAEEGNIYRSAGMNIAANAADTTDDILLGIQLPANIFDVAFRALAITTAGNFAATANNKRLRLWVNPTMAGQTVNADGTITGGTVSGAGSGIMLYDSGTITNNNQGWKLVLNYMKYGAAASNTQNYQYEVMLGTTHGGCSKVTAAAMAENAVMNFVLTGASQTTGAAADVTLNQFQANWMN